MDILEPSAKNIPDDIGIEAAYYDTHTAKATLHVMQEVTNANYDRVYYLPLDYISTILPKELYYPIADGLWYIPQSVSMEVFDVRAETSILIGDKVDKVPIALNDIGFKMLANTGDDMCADCMYPLANPNDFDILKNLYEQSLNQLPGALPQCTLGRNAFLVKTSLVSDTLPRQDHHWVEKNVQPEGPMFEYNWQNDVGLRIPMWILFDDRRKVVSYDFTTINKKNATDNMYSNCIDWAGKDDSEKWEIIQVPATDYRGGFITAPTNTLSDLEEMTRQAALVKQSTSGEWPFKCRAFEHPLHTTGLGEPGLEGIEKQRGNYFFANDPIAENFKNMGSNYEQIDYYPKGYRCYKSISMLKDGVPYKVPEPKQRERFSFGIMRERFSADKTAKRVYFTCMPKCKDYGNSLTNYKLYFSINVTHTIYYKKQDSTRVKPIGLDIDPSTWKFGSDVIFQPCQMKNPLDDGKDILLTNTYIKEFLPDRPVMFKKKIV